MLPVPYVLFLAWGGGRFVCSLLLRGLKSGGCGMIAASAVTPETTGLYERVCISLEEWFGCGGGQPGGTHDKTGM